MSEEKADPDTTKPKTVALDELLPRLGHPGKFQVITFLLLALNYFTVVVNHVCMAFYGSTPKHLCQDSVIEASNSTILGVTYGKCVTSYILGDGQNTTITCKSDPNGMWKYTPYTDRETTIITEWDLVCDDVYLGKLATTIYFLGVMTGGVVFGHIADHFGRKWTMLLCLYAPVALGIGIYFVQTFTAFAVLRFCQGVFVQGLQMSTVALVMELAVREYRGMAGAVFECYWGAGVLILAGIAYFIQTWRYIQLAISLPSILLVFYICLIPESPRWLIMKGRFDDAEHVVKRIAKFNKLPYPADIMDAIRKEGAYTQDKSGKQFTALDLMKSPILRNRTFLLLYLWFATSLGYYGLTFQITSLAGDKYLNFFIGASVEMVAYIGVIYIIKRFGRRKPLTFYFLLGGFCCIIAGVIPFAGTGDDISKASTSFAIIGRFGMGGVFSVIVLYTSELYPTVIRSIGMGCCFFLTRVGGLLAPQILLLGDYTHKSVPIIAFGVLGVIGGVLTLLLPETLGRKLPDSIQDAENMRGTKIVKNEDEKSNSNKAKSASDKYQAVNEGYNEDTRM
ncbi:solute carrier family 22 member 3-like [Mizuhopecten yessoensis]|uniref:Solute carrier family 22 member 13 n=1 Tax=Mizuhopecten yessoensis TaxID=6573 RepID=A0A210PYK9_MIZYE|nr:solute carrier family 22 member 3-like [Mizuhopecten yessoensis]XP_021371701.1 solute carrier family 22 member 3-like [Mizuhopecten yessoensis]OWF41580.1 Solute carrier family 22 member 13 [Mizuhopecten yessoensis]